MSTLHSFGPTRFEQEPPIEGRRPTLAAAARSESKCERHSLDSGAESHFVVNDEARKADMVQRAISIARSIIAFGAHGFTYPAAMN
jgi:hypothetical protein